MHIALFLLLAVIDAAGITVEPGAALTNRTGIYYPREATQNGIEGTVVVELTLNSIGDVLDAHVTSGPEELRKAVLVSVLNWRYEPDGSQWRKVQARVAFKRIERDPRPSIAMSLKDASPEGTTPPALMSRVDPEYPAEALKVRYQGTTVLEALVQADGTVRVTRTIRSLDGNFGEGCRRSVAKGWTDGPYQTPASCPDNLGMDLEAIAAVERWRFKPATKDGAPVSALLTIEVHFNLR